MLSNWLSNTQPYTAIQWQDLHLDPALFDSTGVTLKHFTIKLEIGLITWYRVMKVLKGVGVDETKLSMF